MKIIRHMTLFAMVSLCLIIPLISPADRMTTVMDSLKLELKKNPDNPTSLKGLGENALHLADVRLGRDCAEHLMKLGEKGDRQAATWGNMMMGHVSIMEGYPTKGFEYLNEARELAELRADSASLASILNGIAIYTYTYVGDVPGAIDYYHRGLRCAKAAKDESFYYVLLTNIANAHLELGDTLGLEFAREVYDYADKGEHWWLRYTSALCLADNYHRMKDHTRSLRYISEAEKSLPHLKDYSPFELYHQRGRVLAAVGSDKLAAENFQTAKNYARPVTYRYLTVLNSDAEFEMKRGNLRQAQIMLDSVLNMTSDSVDNKGRLEALALQSRLHELKGDLRMALHFERQHDSLKNMITSLVSTRSMGDAHVRYHFDELTTQLMQEKINKAHAQRAFAIALMSALLLLGGIGFMVYFNRRQKKMHEALVGQMKVAIQTEDMLRTRVHELEEARNPIPAINGDGSLEEAPNGHSQNAAEGNEEVMHGEPQPQDADGAEGVPAASRQRPSGQKSSQLIVEEIERLFENEKSYRDPLLTRDTVAEAIRSNSTYITRAISECYNCGFKQFINNYRIHEAIRILSNPQDDTPIKAIGSMIGFSSATSFYSHFKAATGMTPAVYRETVISTAGG